MRECDLSVVATCKISTNGESESIASVVFFGRVKCLEDLFMVSGWDAGSIVPDTDMRPLVVHDSFDMDRRLCCVGFLEGLNCVGEDVEDDPAYRDIIPPNVDIRTTLLCDCDVIELFFKEVEDCREDGFDLVVVWLGLFLSQEHRRFSVKKERLINTIPKLTKLKLHDLVLFLIELGLELWVVSFETFASGRDNVTHIGKIMNE